MAQDFSIASLIDRNAIDQLNILKIKCETNIRNILNKPLTSFYGRGQRGRDLSAEAFLSKDRLREFYDKEVIALE